VDDLLPWLRAQIAETGRIAQAAKTNLAAWAPGLPPWESARYLGKFASYFDTFVARLDPDAALAQCEAHTAILDAHPCMTDEDDGTQQCGVCVQPGGIGCNEWPEEWRTQPWPCPTVRALALAYQHCPGYREEWRP
jgi:hypothetical protein